MKARWGTKFVICPFWIMVLMIEGFGFIIDMVFIHQNLFTPVFFLSKLASVCIDFIREPFGSWKCSLKFSFWAREWVTIFFQLMLTSLSFDRTLRRSVLGVIQRKKPSSMPLRTAPRLVPFWFSRASTIDYSLGTTHAALISWRMCYEFWTWRLLLTYSRPFGTVGTTGIIFFQGKRGRCKSCSEEG